jgi:hypothetical protein
MSITICGSGIKPSTFCLVVHRPYDSNVEVFYPRATQIRVFWRSDTSVFQYVLLTHPIYVYIYIYIYIYTYFMSLVAPWANKGRVENHMNVTFCSILYGNWQICTTHNHKHNRKNLASDSVKNLKRAWNVYRRFKVIHRYWPFQVFLAVMPCSRLYSS